MKIQKNSEKFDRAITSILAKNYSEHKTMQMINKAIARQESRSQKLHLENPKLQHIPQEDIFRIQSEFDVNGK